MISLIILLISTPNTNETLWMMVLFQSLNHKRESELKFYFLNTFAKIFYFEMHLRSALCFNILSPTIQNWNGYQEYPTSGKNVFTNDIVKLIYCA